MKKILVGAVICGLFLGFQAGAGEQVAKVTQIDGYLKLLSHPSKTLTEKQKVKFDGEYFLETDAKVGEPIENGNILRTTLNSKARLVFPNGDQYYVGPATSYRVSWDKDTANAHPQIELSFGKIRGVVEKGGPRSKLTIRSRGVTMGVRGTDFFVASDEKQGIEVSIMRGQVEVNRETKKGKGEKSAPVVVKTGETVALAAPQAPAPVLRKTTQEELTAIGKLSDVKAELSKDVKPEVKKDVEKLDAKAVEMTLRDIKKTEPKLHAQFDEKKLRTVADIQNAVVQNLIKEAPKAPAGHKPSLSEMEPEQDPYEKYFQQ